MAELTFENKKSLLQAAIKDLYPGEMYPYVEDMTDSKVIYGVSGKHYQAPYSLSKDSMVKLGNPTEVVRQVVYHGVKVVNKGTRIGG